jgi:hypothetical protein
VVGSADVPEGVVGSTGVPECVIGCTEQLVRRRTTPLATDTAGVRNAFIAVTPVLVKRDLVEGDTLAVPWTDDVP